MISGLKHDGQWQKKPSPVFFDRLESLQNADTALIVLRHAEQVQQYGCIDNNNLRHDRTTRLVPGDPPAICRRGVLVVRA